MYIWCLVRLLISSPPSVFHLCFVKLHEMPIPLRLYKVPQFIKPAPVHGIVSTVWCRYPSTTNAIDFAMDAREQMLYCCAHCPPTHACTAPASNYSINISQPWPSQALNTSGQSRQAGHLTVFVGLGISWRNEGLRWCLRDYWVSWVTCVLEFRVNGIRYWFLQPLSRQCRPVLTCCTDTRETLEPSTSPWTINRVHILLRTLCLWPYSYVTGLYFDTSADITVIYQ